MSHPINVNNLTKSISAPAVVKYCDSFLCRLRGLMFRSTLGKNEGLMLVEARDSRVNASIHMLCVPFNLAVFWIDQNMTVVDKIIAKSWHPFYFPSKPARYTLELHTERGDDYQIGDRVEFRDA